jgi:O-antigen ligase
MMVAALGFLVSVAYWPETMGAASSPRWIVMGTLGVGMLAFTNRPIRVTAAHLAGGLFVLWALMTWAWSAWPDDTIAEGWKLLLLAVVFCLGSMQDNLRPLYIAMAAGLALSGIIAIAQFFGWHGLAEWSSPSGLFANRNFYAEICALVAVALISERLWYWLPAVAPGLLLTGARGALLGLTVPLAVMWWRRSRAQTVGFAVVVALILIVMSQYHTVASTSDRLAYWRATAENITPFGKGLGAFFAFFANNSDARPLGLLWEHAHNEVLEIAFETGWVGLGLFTIFAFMLMRAAYGTETKKDDLLLADHVVSGNKFSAGLILIGIAVEACFEFPFHKPATAFFGVCAAGYLTRYLPSLVGEVGHGRMAVRAGRKRAIA